MDENRHARAKDIFLAARERSPRERADFVARATDQDQTLRAEVEDLLRYDDQHGSVTVGRSMTTSGTVFAHSAADLAPELQQRAVRRLGLIGILLPSVLAFTWFIPVLVSGNLVAEFSDLRQWPFPVLVVSSSLAITWISRLAISAQNKLTLGLVYQVLVSYGLVSSQFWGTFTGIPGEFIQPDRVGYTGVAIWMLVYTVVVPTRPARALIALLASATAPPVTYLLNVRFDNAPALTPSTFFLTMVFPYLVSVVLAYVAAQIIYGLGREVSAAREMGSYRLVECIGAGGMGEVWRANHRLLARPAAVKLIRRDAIAKDPHTIETAIRRFEREAQVTASLRSAHTVELYDFGVADDGSLYYVMELLDGVDLDRMVQWYGPLPPGRALRLIQQACLSLTEAHQRGLIHRDIKPANLVVCRMGTEYDVLKVLDFGLVRPTRSSRHGFTPESTFAGTPAFMSPEIAAASDDIDGRTDIYALGCVMYWMLTGQHVFKAASLVEMLAAHVHEQPVAPGLGVDGVPTILDDIILKCLAKDRGDRFATAADLYQALDLLHGQLPWSQQDAVTWWKKHGSARPDNAPAVFGRL